MSGIEKLRGALSAKKPDNFGVPMREKLYPGEDSFFKSNPHVAGMAAEDNAVILNPYSNLKPEERNAVAANEAARIYMRTGKNRPSFAITPEQKKAFAETAYGKDEQALRETLAARIYSGDPSVGKATPEQIDYVDRILRRR